VGHLRGKEEDLPEREKAGGEIQGDVNGKRVSGRGSEGRKV